MTTQNQAFDAQVKQKINEMMPYLIKTANGDEDLIQEGAIGIWESMMKDPEAPNRFYATKAKWNIKTVARGVGKSVDIPKWHKRKTPITIIHHDAELSQAVLADRRRIPLDDYVINKMDFEWFINNLYSTEAEYIRCKVVEELPDCEISNRLDITVEHIRFMKKGLRDKIEGFFGI
jgi:hypothetical protein